MTRVESQPGECGRLVGRYRLGQLLGQGPASKVYRGMEPSAGEAVAIKVLHPHVAADATAMLDRLRNEGKVLAQLHHPSIVRLVEMVEQRGQICLVMEYLPGGSLKDLILRESRLPVRRAAEIGLDLADALACAHDAGLLHRDVKPSNILLAEDGTPRLSDFGVASLSESATGRLGESARQRRSLASGVKGEARRFSDSPARPLGGGVVGRVGTLAYMSPEAYRGEEVGPESDIWSLGVVLFEMLAGRLPFDDPRSGSAADTPVPPIAVFRPDVQDDLGALVREMLQTDRTRRLASAGEVAARLEAVLARFGRAKGRPAGGPGVLPDYATHFVGREPELESLAACLSDQACGPTSLVGPGGVGKSRLAVEAAARVQSDFPDGVWFVPLGSVGSPSHIVSAVATAIGFSFHGPSDPKVQLINYLREKRLLLVLDNFEHLLDGAALLDDILEAAPQVRLLVTSRELLGLESETVVEVAGLALPDAAAPVAEDYGAVRLFLDCATAASSEFEASAEDMVQIVRICELVEGMPLGIELAAAWAGERSPCEIAREIESNIDSLVDSREKLPERHRSMRAVFDHSWSLLHDSEQRAFARTSVFRGGFTLESARRVVGAPIGLLSALVGKSLLRRGATGRYYVHELLRQYAHEVLRLSAQQLSEVAALHAEYYSSFVRRREVDVRRGDRAVLESIDEEMDNVRSAWRQLLDRGSPADIVRMLDSLRPYYEARSLFVEGAELSWQAVEALRRVPAGTDRPLATALVNRAGFLQRLSRFQEALPSAAEALALMRDSGSDTDTAFAANVLGIVHLCLGDYTSAEGALNEALARFEACGDLKGMATVLNNLGNMAHERGEVEKTRGLRERALEACRRAGYLRGVESSLYNLGVLHLELGEHENARSKFHECLELCRQVRDRRGEAVAQMNLAFALAFLGQREGLGTLLEESRTVLEELGDVTGVVDVILTHGEVCRILGDHGAAKELFLEALQPAEETGRAWHKVVAPACLAEITRLLGEYDQSMRWHREAIEQGTRYGVAVKVAEALVGLAQLMQLRGDHRKGLEAALLAVRTCATGASVRGDPQALIAQLEAELPPAAVDEVRTWARSGPLDDLARQLVAEETSPRNTRKHR